MGSVQARHVGLDLARLVMSVLIVAVHCELWRDTSPVTSFFLIEGVGRIGVPFFFVLTGFFFERDQRVSLGNFLRRIGWLYAVWMLAYLPWSWPELAVRPVWTLVFGYWHLWYLAALGPAFGLLVLMRRLSVAAMLGGAVALYLAGYAIEIAALVGFGWRDAYPYYRNAVFDALPLLAIGAVLARSAAQVEAIATRQLRVAIGVVMALFLGEVALFWWMVPDAHVDMYLSILPASALIFVLVSRLRINWHIPQAARMATAVYFIHPMILMTVAPYVDGSTALFAATLIGSIGAAAALVWLNRHVTVL